MFVHCFSMVLYTCQLFLHSTLCLSSVAPQSSTFAHCFSIVPYVCPVFLIVLYDCLLFHYYSGAQTAMKRHFIEESQERKHVKFVSKTGSKFRPRFWTTFLPATWGERPLKIGFHYDPAKSGTSRHAVAQIKATLPKSQPRPHKSKQLHRNVGRDRVMR